MHLLLLFLFLFIFCVLDWHVELVGSQTSLAAYWSLGTDKFRFHRTNNFLWPLFSYTASDVKEKTILAVRVLMCLSIQFLLVSLFVMVVHYKCLPQYSVIRKVIFLLIALAGKSTVHFSGLKMPYLRLWVLNA